jgi:hypothetical protein
MLFSDKAEAQGHDELVVKIFVLGNDDLVDSQPKCIDARIP